MCIALLTTAHPDYALIALDNRDEFILRPTSRLHWWTAPVTSSAPNPNLDLDPDPDNPPPPPDSANTTTTTTAHQEILSSRDLLRAERGTWLGITRTGHFAVLTNYREDPGHAAAAAYASARSRGAIVTAWLTAPPAETTRDFVARSLGRGGIGVRGIGGFSLICGKFRPRQRRRRGSEPQEAGDDDDDRTLEPLAVLSNRTDHPERVPWICGARGEVHGLSNTHFDDPAVWPKVRDGKAALRQTVDAAVAEGYSQARLIEALFAILDTDTLPKQAGQQRPFEESLGQLKHSIFIPAVGDPAHQAAMAESVANGRGKPTFHSHDDDHDLHQVLPHGRPADSPAGFMTGMYGTQRQTVVLVDWDGKVTYVERALWDAHGNPIERGKGDATHQFEIEGWSV